MEFVAVKEESYLAIDCKNIFKGKIKCGEILLNNSYTTTELNNIEIFSFLCTFCDNSFLEIEKFFLHMKCDHINVQKNDPLDENEHVIKIENRNTKQVLKLNNNNSELIDKSKFENKLPDDNSLLINITEKTKIIKKNRLKKLTKNNTFACDICEKNFTAERTLKRHRKYDHIPLDPFIVENAEIDKLSDDSDNERTDKTICSKSKQKQERTIASTETIDDPFKCRYCNRHFNDRFTRTEHERIHTGETPFKCNFCDKCFRTKSYCTRHEKTHSDLKPYKCNKCNMSFKQNNSLFVHMKRHGEKKYSCAYCEKKFFQSIEKTRHERIHTGEKPYQCNTCGQCFRTGGRLNLHNLSHSGKKPFKCDKCDKSFYTKTTLNEHIVQHTGERPFACTICKSTFARRKTLRVHAKLHSDITKYKCTICGKGFKQFPGLYCHMKSHEVMTKL